MDTPIFAINLLRHSELLFQILVNLSNSCKLCNTKASNLQCILSTKVRRLNFNLRSILSVCVCVCVLYVCASVSLCVSVFVCSVCACMRVK